MIYPQRGMSFTDPSQTHASGTISDESGLSSFLVNGTPVPVQPDGTWTLAVDPLHGQNLLLFEAEDGAGNLARETRCFHYSTNFAPMTGDLEKTFVPGAVVAFLGDELFMDDDDPLYLASLVGMARALVTEDFINDLVPDKIGGFGLWPCNEYEVKVDEIEGEELRSTAVPQDGGVKVKVRLDDFSVETALNGKSGLCIFGGTKGDVEADKVMAWGFLGAGLDGGYPYVDLEDNGSDLDDLHVDGENFGGDLAGLVVNLFEGYFTDLTEDLIDDVIDDQVGSLLEGSLDFLIMDEELSFELIPGAPVTIRYATGYDALSFSWDGALVALRATVRGEPTVDLPTPGAIRRGDCLGLSPDTAYSPSGARLEFAVLDDLLNQALHALWVNGALRVTLDADAMAGLGADLEALGISNPVLEVEGLLPPIVDSCAAPGKRLLQVGDLFVHAAFELLGVPVDVRLYLAAETALGLSVVEEDQGPAVELSIAPFHYFLADVEYLNPEWQGKEHVIRGLVEELVAGMLEDSLAPGKVRIPIPVLALGGLSSHLPQDLGITLGDAAVSYSAGRTVASGDAVVTDAPGGAQ